MNWKSKFKIISQRIETNDDIEQDFYVKEKGASSESISELQKKYPFVSEEYIEFIKFTDGADIAQCRLYGTTEYSNGEEMYSEEYPKDIWFPFGHEAGGDPLLLHQNGKVAIGKAKNISGEYQYLASNFSEFLSEVLMGSLFPSIFRVNEESFGEFIKEELESEEDPWLMFLVEQKWLVHNE